MIFKYLKLDKEIPDKEFDSIYPNAIKCLANVHFTPVAVAKLAAQYLANQPNAKILDIGSGGGKFCMVGSACTNGHFTGIEQRKNLCSVSNNISKRYALSNITFIHGNIMDIDFKAFNGFYFFNSFFEHIIPIGSMDKKIILDKLLFRTYSNYVKEQLTDMPIGTKLVTYHTYSGEIPISYTVQSTSSEGKLKMWMKTN